MYHLSCTKRKFWLFLLVLALLIDSVPCRRGGGGFGGGRGASAARGAGRGSSGGRGTSGGYGSGSPGIFTSSRNTYKTNYGGGGTGGYFAGSGKWDDRSKSSSFVRTPTYTKGSGIGSKLRSNTFKNMIVGAAAGYLTYQAGKAIIRSAMGPMMWNSRPYYWGSSYYRPQYPNQPMCRMPIDNSDPQFGNVYFQDQTRPREIVWGCAPNEHCCGYECCPGGYGSGYGGYGGGGYYGGSGRSFSQFSFGSIIVVLLFCLCGGFIIHQICKARQASGAGSWFGGNKYTPGQANEPPPRYSTSGATFTYPPPPNVRS